MKKRVAEIVQTALQEFKLKVSLEDIEKTLETPPSPEMGDFSFPCFFLENIVKESPHQIAIMLREKMSSYQKTSFEDIRSIGPYLNFFVNRTELALLSVNEALKRKEKYGKSQEGKGKKTMIEFSQPNTHKAFHVGHIRGTSLGESLARILEFNGEKVIRANYSGDTGMHIAKWIWCYLKYHKKERIRADERWIASIYVDAVKRLTKNKTKKFDKEVAEINKKIESKEDPKINKIWRKTRRVSIDSWSKIYSELNAKFDVHYFESSVEKRGKELAEELLNRGIGKISDKATIVDLEKYGKGIWVVLRSDGTVLYSAKDLALAEKKIKDFKMDRYLVAIGNEQKNYFEQLFKVLELMGIKESSKFFQVNFGMIRLPTGKMSSRTGDNILYSDFIKELKDYSSEEIKKRFPKLKKQEIERRALKIAVSAIKYSFLKQGANKDIVFNKKEATNFDGNTGPYILYSYARANSILRKVRKRKLKKIKELEEKEVELSRKLGEFPEIVSRAYQEINPSLVANHLYACCHLFNEFYSSCQVIGGENEVFRINLVKAFKQVIKNGMNLLAIDLLERM
jgi:arginyl-tRNA synthetase